MKRILAFAYGVVCYGLFFATFLYAIGFLGNFGVPKSIDSGGVIWKIDDRFSQGMMIGLFAEGLLLVLVSTILINHFDLFGLRQVSLYLARLYIHLQFRTPFSYCYVRYALYLGWLLTFWCTPVMTVHHLFLAAMTTAYIFVAIRLEETPAKTAAN